MSNKLLLLPQPRQLIYLKDVVSLSAGKLIVLNGPNPQHLRFTAKRLQQALRNQVNINWQIIAGNAISAGQIGLMISVVPGGLNHPQGYQLTISSTGIFIVAATPAGAFYAVSTLIQILEQADKNKLPCLQIKDWPDFIHRSVMLDISRDKVPTTETLFNLIDMLASWKVNQLQLYTEHTYAYQNHPEVWADASPMTGEEILKIDAYCRERFVELVPNQNSFGHMHRWLKHDRYRHLAECPDGCDTEWGYFDLPFSLCPTDPGSLALIQSLMNELLPHFSSRQFNVGCDETVDLGQGRSRQLVAERGKGRVYLDFLLKIYREVKSRGRTMQFWGDIIMNYPELVGQLPRDIIALEWGYEADHPFDDHGAKFAVAGIPYYVCPGTSSWNTVAGRTDNALKNLRNAAENGLKHGAVGYLITDWGDNGHWQPLPVSYLGFVYGAALAWAFNANRDLDIAQLTGFYAFQDNTGKMGRLVYDLGNAYLEPGASVHNGSLLFWILQESPTQIATREGVITAGLQKSLRYIDKLRPALSTVQSNRSDSDLIRREITWCIDLLDHACRRGMWALDRVQNREDRALRQQLAQDADRLIAEHRHIWLARNRKGGLKDSQARLEKMRADYGEVIFDDRHAG